MQSPPLQIADALQQLSQSDALRELESRLTAQNAFNLFDAIGVSNQELRHSDFLAFLLRPNEAHGLGDTFLKWFLGHALAQSPAPPISRDTLNAWDLSDADVQREWNNVALFITSEENRLAVVVENKIDTSEHSDQLVRYKQIAEAHGYSGPDKKLLCLYLTPRGIKSSHADYLPLGYAAICAHLETVSRRGAFVSAKSADIEIIVQHYTRMLRRKIVGDPEIIKLCHELYGKHQAAFERVFAEVKNKEIQKDTTNQLIEWIGDAAGLEVVGSKFYDGISISFFGPSSWTNEKALLRNELTKWIIYLQTETYRNGKVIIQGVIAPCERTLRTRLRRTVEIGLQVPVPDKGYAVFYTYPLRDADSGLATSSTDLYKAWQEWVETEGPKFAALIQPGDFPAA